MYGLAGILEHRVAQDFDMAGIRVHFGVHQMSGETDAGTFCIDFTVTGNGSAGGTCLGSDISQCQRVRACRHWDWTGVRRHPPR